MKTIFLTFLLFSGILLAAQPRQNTFSDSCHFSIPGKLYINPSSAALKIERDCNLQFFSFTLYDRWGKKVFFTETYTEPLDLTLLNKIEEGSDERYKFRPELYCWIIEYKRAPAGGSRKQLGCFTVVVE